VHGLHQMNHRLLNRFEHTRWYSQVAWIKWKIIFMCLEIVLISKQDRCMVCADCTIGLEIILDAPDSTPR
jgi:hypothetical protein